jgi:hypothetical protein
MRSVWDDVNDHRATSGKIPGAKVLLFWESLLYPEEKPGARTIDTSSRKTLALSTLATMTTPSDGGAWARVSGPDSDAIELASGYENGEWWNILHFEFQCRVPEQGFWYVNITFQVDEGVVPGPYLEIFGQSGPLPERFRKAFEQAEIEIPAI